MNAQLKEQAKTYIDVETLKEIDDLDQAKQENEKRQLNRKLAARRAQIHKDYRKWCWILAGSLAMALGIRGVQAIVNPAAAGGPAETNMPQREAPVLEGGTQVRAEEDFGEKLNLVNANGTLEESSYVIKDADGNILYGTGAPEAAEDQDSLSVYPGMDGIDPYSCTSAGFIQIGTSWDELVYQLGDLKADGINARTSDGNDISLQEISLRDFDEEYVKSGKMDLRERMTVYISTSTGSDGNSYFNYAQMPRNVTIENHDYLYLDLTTPSAFQETDGSRLLVSNYYMSVEQ